MAVLARAAPCPRLLLRSTTSSSRKAPQSPSPSPSPPPRHVRFMRCHAASATCLWRSPASPSPVPQHHQQRRSFRCTAGVRQDLARRNHYERLQVSPAATPGDIKKSFYKLSKAHHPDANRNDPNAAHTFSLLSESYTLLSDPSRRATYDRNVIARLQPSPASSSSKPSHGSYHSATYPSAGGRPASGLSKRRGTFRGPPPSFYRNGGWGAQTDRRRRAEEQASSAASSSSSSSSSAHYTNYKGSSSSGGADAFTAQQAPGGRFHRAEDHVPPHFDKEGHRKTHEKEDERRWARRRRALDEEDVEFEPQASLGAHFAIVLGILGATVLVPVWYLNTVSGKKKSKEY